jgi:hypothetical protein
MKKILFIVLLILITVNLINAQTEGTLTVTTTTSSAGGNYSPKNIVAIWIEDEQGNFVKTLLAYAQNRITHLNTWEASTTAAGSPFNTIDAITGATKPNHDTRTCTWNGTGVSGALVADGIYKVRMELTDKNATGNFSTFTFTKGPSAENQSPANVPSFSNISVIWEPLFTSVEENIAGKDYQFYPNPSSGIFTISGEHIREIQIRNVAGSLIYHGKSDQVDIRHQPDGIYFVKIRTEKGIIITKKIVKKS